MKVKTVWLGGGVISGALGVVMGDEARKTLDDAGSSLTVQVALWPDALPLIGAARSQVGTEETMLVCDFGATSAKHGWAEYQGGLLKELKLLPRKGAPAVPPTVSPEAEPAIGSMWADFILGLIQEDWQLGNARGVPGSFESRLLSAGQSAAVLCRFRLCEFAASLV